MQQLGGLAIWNDSVNQNTCGNRREKRQQTAQQAAQHNAQQVIGVVAHAKLQQIQQSHGTGWKLAKKHVATVRQFCSQGLIKGLAGGHAHARQTQVFQAIAATGQGQQRNRAAAVLACRQQRATVLLPPAATFKIDPSQTDTGLLRKLLQSVESIQAGICCFELCAHTTGKQHARQGIAQR